MGTSIEKRSLKLAGGGGEMELLETYGLGVCQGGIYVMDGSRQCFFKRGE